MIFVVFALLTGVAVLAVLAPLAFRGGDTAADPDIAFFEEQIAEIARERAEGRLSEADAEAANTEAARRLLRAEAAAKYGPSQSRRAGMIAALVALVAIPAISVPLYLKLGNVEMPDMPLQARLDARPNPNDLDGAVARIEQHLREHPEDGRGHEVIAPYLLRTGRVEDAIHAYFEALRLLGPTAERHSALGEARVVAAKGVVTAEAVKDFEAAQALDAAAPMPRYYLALAAGQAGDKDKAVALFEKMIADAPEGAAYVRIVKQQIASLRGENPAEAPAAQSAQGPGSAQGKAIQSMPADQQQQMIRTMVGRLADRLAKNGDDVEGWLKLIRAYSVLSDADKAKQALMDARKALAGKTSDVARVEALAKELNIGG